MVVLALLSTPFPLVCQDNTNWIFNLSEGVGEASTGLNDYQPEIAADGNNVHAIWLTHAPSADYNTYQLNYRRSANNGETWGSKIKLQEGLLDPNRVFNRIFVSGNYVHIVVSWNAGTAEELRYFRSTNGGASFEAPKVLYSTTFDLYNLHIAGDGSKVRISFTDDCWWCGTKKWFRLLKSDNNGSTFETTTVLEDFVGDLSNFASIAVEGNNVYMLYMQSIGYWANYDFELHLLSSNDGGSTFANHVISSPASNGIHHVFQLLDGNNGYCPKIATDGNKVWVIWSGYDAANQATIFVNHSTDGGATVSAPVKVSGDVHYLHTGLETIAAKGDHAYIVFNTGDNRLYFNHSGDGGTTFGTPIEFTRPEGRYVNGGIEPQIVLDPLDNGAYVVGTGPLWGKISPQGQLVEGPTFLGNFSFTSSRRPRVAIAANGYAHLVVEGGGDWLLTGAFADSETWYRRLNLNPTEVGQTEQALRMDIIMNPGDGSGLSRYDNMAIGPELGDQFTDAITVELWVNLDTVAFDKRILTQLNNGTWNINNPVTFQLWTTANNQPVAGIMTSTGAYAIWGTKNLLQGYWNHLAVTYQNDGSPQNFKLLLNGQVIASTTATGDLIQSDADWFLGCTFGGFSGHPSAGFAGSVDELRFWDQARTAEQIRQNRFADIPVDEEGLAAYYKFNAISPFGEVTDASGNGHTGYLMYKEEAVPDNIKDLGTHFTYVQTVASFAFFQESDGGESFQWDFGNGTTSNGANPTVTYQTPGVYNVCLSAYGDDMYDTYCEEVVVQGIEKIQPTVGGNTDYVTLYIYGGGFNANNVVKLRRSGYPDIVAEQTILDARKTLTALLNLDDQQTGAWDLVIANGAQEMVLPAAFQIVPGEVAKPYVLYNGGGTILFNRWMPQSITLGNSANVDAHGVLLWVTIPNAPGNDIAFLNLNVQAPQLAIDNGWEDELDAPDYYVVTDSLFGKPSNSRVYVFYFSILPAKSSMNIAMRVKIGTAGGTVPLQVWLSEPFYHSPISPEVQGCVALSVVKALIKGGAGFIPGVPCLTGSMAVVSNYLNDQPPTPSAVENIDTRSWFWILGTNILECGSSLIPGGNVYAGILGLITSGVENAQENADCYSGFRQIGLLDILYYPVWSLDPNEKKGMPGFAEEGYIGRFDRLGYQVSFENKSTATAPAHEVTIVDTLTFSKADLSNFAFGSFGWGDTLLFPLPGSKAFSMDVDLRPAKDLIVRVTGELNETDRIATWHFLSLNPTTMDYEEDPFGGFLPPNVTPPEGEGFVSFTMGIQDNIQNGDVIENRASIVFDANAPILTNLHRNTFDLAAPNSMLSTLATTTTDTLVALNLSAYDGGSQVRHVEIWASENDSAYVFSQSAHADLVNFVGKTGSTYKFYSIAVDSVGNREAIPTTPDAVVTFLVNATSDRFSASDIRLYPNPAQHQVTLELNMTQSATMTATLEDLTGRQIQTLFRGHLTTGKQFLRLQLQAVPGIYFLRISDGVGSRVEKVVVSDE